MRNPHDTMPAFERGFDNQADAVKGDFRTNMESEGMVMHSSPVEWFESFDCQGKKVETRKMEITDMLAKLGRRK